MKQFKFKINGNQYEVQIQSFEDNLVEVEVNGTAYKVELQKEVKMAKTPKLVRAKTPVAAGGLVGQMQSSDTKLAQIKSPLPGAIIHILVKPGDAVKKEQPLLLLEAMKMENKVLSEVSGTVKSVKVQAGENVLQGQVLMEIE
jgi:glutaconyl-CoA/methylmalonyl-CoA decarboxylase subunit gamma